MPITVHRKNIGSFYWTTSGANKILPGICGTTTNAFFIDPTVVNTLGGTIYSTFTQSQLQSNFAFTTSSNVTATSANFLDTAWAAQGWSTSNDFTFNAQLLNFIRNNFGQYSINPEAADVDLILSRGYIYNTDSATSLLMHFDNTLADSSQYNTAYSNFSAITYVGGKFGQAASFNGTSSNVQIPAGSSGGIFDFASGNWTIDFWFNTSVNNANKQYIIGGDWQVYLQSDKITFTDGGSNTLTTTSTYTTNVYNHVAIVNNGGTLTIYLNGVSGASTAFSAPIAFTNTIWLGEDGTGANWFSGELDELRVTKGSALWITGFSAPTAAYNLPLHSIPWVYFGNQGDTDNFTSLLLHFDNSSGSSSHDVSANLMGGSYNSFCGLTSEDSKFGYSSVYFDGVTNGSTAVDFVSFPSVAALNFGSGNFTFECWFNYSSALTTSQMAIWSDQYLYSAYGVKINNGFMGYYATSANGNTFWNMLNGDSGGNSVGSIPIIPNQWNHVAFVRNGNVWTGYINGQQDMTVTVSGTVSSGQGNWQLGNWASSGQGPGPNSGFPPVGYVDELRVSNNARYTGSSFTVPNAPFVSDANTELLVHFETDGVIDASNWNWACTNNAGTALTYQAGQFNSAASFSGSTIQYYPQSGSPLDMQNQDFTVDCWFNTSGGNYTIWAQAGSNFGLGNNTNRNFSFTMATSVGSTNGLTTVNTLWTPNAWNHVAYTRHQHGVFLYCNGALVGSSWISGNGTLGNLNPGIMALVNNGTSLIDEFRVSKGVARYTPGFTPAVAAYTSDANTSLLLHFDGNVTDSSSNSISVTANNSPTFVTGQFGQAINFASSSQSATFSMGAAAGPFDLGNNFAIDFWINPASLPSVGNTAQIYSNTNLSLALANNVGQTPGSLNIFFGGLINVNSNEGQNANYITIPVNTWTHIAMEYVPGVSSANPTQGTGANSLIVFINGAPKLVFIGNVNLSFTASSTFTLGGGMIGAIDEFRITKGVSRWTGNYSLPPIPYY